MARLSLAMIVRNEAGRLGACLESARGVADEMVVLDTGSTDGTREVAAAHGARVETFPWIDDFAAARNASLGLCTGDWTLVLDADERLDAACGRALALRSFSYATVVGILKNGTENVVSAEVPSSSVEHANVRGKAYFAGESRGATTDTPSITKCNKEGESEEEANGEKSKEEKGEAATSPFHVGVTETENRLCS